MTPQPALWPDTTGSADRKMLDEVVQFCSALIQINSTNTGDPASTGSGESECARYIAQHLEQVGFSTEWFERTTGRGNLIVRIEGQQRQLPALLFHAHTDVVTADESQWSMSPFSGAILDGQIWGRGAVDMKNMIAMLVAVLRDLAQSDWQPQRDLVFAFVADEEVESENGMGFLVEQHPEIFTGVTEAIGELGGFSFDLASGRHYTIGVAEKGVAWATLTANGAAGHGSLVANSDNALVRMVGALHRIGQHEWSACLTGASLDVLEALGQALGRPIDTTALPQSISELGAVASMFAAGFATTTAVTQAHGGTQTNVVSASATATVDCRILPGTEAEFHRTFAELVGEGIDVTWQSAPSVSVEAHSPLTEAIQRAVATIDQGARTIPFVTGAATDAKSLQRLGIKPYGFVPLALPEHYDFAQMFHGIDERIPISALGTGALILRELIRNQ
ncbi:MAG: M20/M25/M40 family metallo-hydrolase [Rhodoglobus sp.]